MLKKLYNDCLFNANDYVEKSRNIAELFLWAVFSNLPDMMDVLLFRGHGLLKKALIGEKASKLMIEIAEKQGMLDDLISQYKKSKQ